MFIAHQLWLTEFFDYHLRQLRAAEIYQQIERRITVNICGFWLSET